MPSPRPHGIKQQSSITWPKGSSRRPARANRKILGQTGLTPNFRPISKFSKRSPPTVALPRTGLLGCRVGRFSRPLVVEKCYRQRRKRPVVLGYFRTRSAAREPAIDKAGIEVAFQKVRMLQDLKKEIIIGFDSFDMVLA